MVTVAIIPARGGSKRIPKKNIKEFHGKPIIAYSIETALQSKLFDKVIVSTDDEEIAEVSRQYGAEVPFLRPDTLSGDFMGTHAVVDHSLCWLHAQGVDITYACCIYATSPLLQPKYLEMGYKKIQENKLDFVMSVTAYPFPIQRALYISEDSVAPVNHELYSSRSQDLREAYHDAAQFYWGTPKSFHKNKQEFVTGAAAIVLPRNIVCDIDTPEDWLMAEKIFESLN